MTVSWWVGCPGALPDISGAHRENHSLQNKANLLFHSLCRREGASSSDDEPLHPGDMLAVDTPAQKSLPTYKKSLRLSSEQIVCPLLLLLHCLFVHVGVRQPLNRDVTTPHLRCFLGHLSILPWGVWPGQVAVWALASLGVA